MTNADSWGKSKPAANHPWQHPQLRSTAEPNTTEARCRKVTMTVTRPEERSLRARALQAHMSISQFVRTHFPGELLLPLLE